MEFFGGSSIIDWRDKMSKHWANVRSNNQLGQIKIEARDLVMEIRDLQDRARGKIAQEQQMRRQPNLQCINRNARVQRRAAL